MVSINKEEALRIHERFPRAHIVRTMKKKSGRHRYYCEETSRVMQFLQDMRSEITYEK